VLLVGVSGALAARPSADRAVPGVSYPCHCFNMAKGNSALELPKFLLYLVK
jgi:hypothetical protein